MCESQNQQGSTLDLRVFLQYLLILPTFITRFNYVEGKFHQLFMSAF